MNKTSNEDFPLGNGKIKMQLIVFASGKN